MKIASIAASLLLALPALAFPPWMLEQGMSEDEIRQALSKRVDTPLAPGFDAEQQLVSTSGDHEFIAPGPDDLRGPCPGLNAMANHGYIPRNGVATIAQFIQGNYDVFGMGLDLGGYLSTYGAVLDGDAVKWSIGGPPPGSLLGNLLGKPKGISGSHPNYEVDVSITRGDLYQTGDNINLNMTYWEGFYNTPQGPYGYDLSTLTTWRAERFHESVTENPYFFNGAFSGVVVQAAAYTFVYRFFANKSEEYPDGYLNSDVLKSFFSITGEPGSFEYTPGNERIPDNWYKRAIGDEYTIPFLFSDIIAAAVEHPEFISIGGNTGEQDTFTGVDLGDLTGGVFYADTLLEGDNLSCFVFQFVGEVAPDILKNLFKSILKPLAQLSDAADKILGGLVCPELASIDSSLFDQFPGAKGSY